MDEEKLTLRVPEAAALSGIGRDALYTLARRADFPSIKVGRRIYIHRRAFEQWLEKEALKVSPS